MFSTRVMSNGLPSASVVLPVERSVRRDVEVVEVAEHVIHADTPTFTELTTDARGVLERIRRGERVSDERVHTRDHVGGPENGRFDPPLALNQLNTC